MADKSDKEKRRKVSGISNNNKYYAGGDVIRTGYMDTERYRERVRPGTQKQSFPNMRPRRKITTGRDLTTRLTGRIKITHKRVSTNIRTVAAAKKLELPWLLIGKILLVAAFVCGLIYSYIVLFEADYNINMTNKTIKSEQIRTQVLERQYALENDPAETLKIAREEYGMIEENNIQKIYIKSQREDRAVITDNNKNKFQEIFNIVYNRIKK